MQMGTVTSELWFSRAPEAWQGHRMVCVAVERVDGERTTEVVAADTIGARVGETVLVGSSSRVRDLVVGPDVPAKTVVVAIVDSVDRAPSGQPTRRLADSPRRGRSSRC